MLIMVDRIDSSGYALEYLDFGHTDELADMTAPSSGTYVPVLQTMKEILLMPIERHRIRHMDSMKCCTSRRN